MKKFAVLILAFFYLCTSSGATVNIHYCMGDFAGWDIGADDSDHCGSCGMDKQSSTDSNCCKDEQKIIKVEDDHKSPVAGFIVEAGFASLSAPPYILEQPLVTSLAITYPVTNAPPGIIDDITILTRTLRI